MGFIFILDVCQAFALLALGVGLKFGRNNVSERFEEVEDLLLSNLFIDVSDEQVSVLIILRLGRGIDDADGLSINLGVVHLVEATLSFFFLNELKVSISAGLVSLRIDDNLGILDLESSGGEELVEVKIKEALLRKTADIETRKFVHSCLALLLVLNVSTLSVRSMSNVHVVELLSEEILGVR